MKLGFHDAISNWMKGAGELGRKEAAELVGRLGHAAQVGISGSVVGSINSDKDEIDTPQRAQTIAQAFAHQLGHLDDESEIQRQKLALPGEHSTLMLEVAIYGLTGIREQLEKSLSDFDSLTQMATLQQAKKVAAAEGKPDTAVDPSRLHLVHEAHGTTRVQAEPVAPEPARSTGILSFFRRQPAPLKPNEQMARDLSAIYQQFGQESKQIVEAFRAAQAQSLQELNVPVDLLRATANWLHGAEQNFYQEEQAMRAGQPGQAGHATGV